MESIQKKISLINEASDAADALPTDLEELRKARSQIEKLSTESATTQGKIQQRWDEIEKLLLTMSEKSVDADKLVKQTEEAYRVATSIGLAGAFDQRSKSMAWSMRFWVVGLLVALGGGTAIGASRVRVLTDALSSSSPNWGIVWIHIILSVVRLERHYGLLGSQQSRSVSVSESQKITDTNPPLRRLTKDIARKQLASTRTSRIGCSIPL